MRVHELFTPPEKKKFVDLTPRIYIFIDRVYLSFMYKSCKMATARFLVVA